MDGNLDKVTSKKTTLIQKRVSSWDNFFDKTQEKFLSRSVENSSEEEVFHDQDDALFKAVDEDYRKLRKSVLEENGITEEPCIVNGDKVPQKVILSRKEKHFGKSVKPALRKKVVANRNKKNVQMERFKGKERGFQSIFKKQTSEASAKSKSSQMARLKESLKKTSEKCMRSENYSHTNYLSKIIINSEKDSAHRMETESLSKKMITTQNKNSGCSESSTSTKSRDEKIKKSFKISTSNVKIYSRDDYSKFCEHLELWKLYKRQKAGTLRSIYICDSLDDEPTEANRCVLELPAVVAKPILEPPRFILKAPIRSQ